MLKNPLSINPAVAQEGYKPQEGVPEDDELLLFGHHHPATFGASLHDHALQVSHG